MWTEIPFQSKLYSVRWNGALHVILSQYFVIFSSPKILKMYYFWWSQSTYLNYSPELWGMENLDCLRAQRCQIHGCSKSAVLMSGELGGFMPARNPSPFKYLAQQECVDGLFRWPRLGAEILRGKTCKTEVTDLSVALMCDACVWVPSVGINSVCMASVTWIPFHILHWKY